MIFFLLTKLIRFWVRAQIVPNPVHVGFIQVQVDFFEEELLLKLNPYLKDFLTETDQILDSRPSFGLIRCKLIF